MQVKGVLIEFCRLNKIIPRGYRNQKHTAHPQWTMDLSSVPAHYSNKCCNTVLHSKTTNLYHIKHMQSHGGTRPKPWYIQISSTVKVYCNEKYTRDIANRKLSSLQAASCLNWKKHTGYMNPKLRGACYVLTLILHIGNTDILKAIRFGYFHSTEKYELLLWSNLPNSRRTFILQKKIIRIMVSRKYLMSKYEYV
jgi:hypothetical protein